MLSLNNAKILYVEDDQFIRSALQKSLSYRIKNLHTACNGREGLKEFIEYNPDIVITDIQMPEMDGLEMAKEIKAINPDVPIIILTSYNDQEYFIKAIEVGIDKYIFKPVNIDKLLKTIMETFTHINYKRESTRLRKTIEDTMRLSSLAQLTRGLSHNFNNILVGIMGYAGLIRLKLTQSGGKNLDINELTKYIDNIEKSADRAAELIKKMVLFSEYSSTDKEKVNIKEIITYLLDILKMAFPSNIVIETNIADSLPPLIADKGKIVQALLNICINAKEAMTKGGTLSIDVNLTEDNFILIKITDTGCGMDEETQRRAIEPFFTTKNLINHFGFGLSIAHGIVKNHNGQIDIQSEINQGTTVFIKLPIS